jgi:hypothetical protein
MKYNYYNNFAALRNPVYFFLFRYVVYGGTPSFIILVKDTPFQEQFKTKYNLDRWSHEIY